VSGQLAHLPVNLKARQSNKYQAFAAEQPAEGVSGAGKVWAITSDFPATTGCRKV